MNIAVLLSGGVDSSVVVHLLCEQGYRPSLFYIKIWIIVGSSGPAPGVLGPGGGLCH